MGKKDGKYINVYEDKHEKKISEKQLVFTIVEFSKSNFLLMLLNLMMSLSLDKVANIQLLNCPLFVTILSFQ